MELKCIVVNDNIHPLFDQYIRHTSEFSLLAVFEELVDAKEYLKDKRTDIIFLDYNLWRNTKLNPFGDLSDLPLIVLTSSFSLRFFPVSDPSIFSLLVYPWVFNNFAKVREEILSVAQVLDFFVKNENLSNGGPHHTLTKLLVDITHFESIAGCSMIYTETSSQKFAVNIIDLEQYLNSYGFLRVHENFIVSINRIGLIWGDCLELETGLILPISSNFLQGLLLRFN